ncbi:MAG TPA: hypothetical protein VK753_04190 [Xanthomonadaceae bacterium]|jgi:hypothetical protein|nr:hypothetical protein [Xanthomonadaceae bacterium]
MSLARRVEPEMLDSLPAEDPRAVRSRKDLRRVNRIMGTCGLIGGALDPIVNASPTARIVELGAGDGSLMLRIARRHARHWPKLRIGLLDMQPVVRADTLIGFQDEGWYARVIGADVFDWLAQPADGDAPIVVANLFVHHFDGERLRALLTGIASKAGAFVCCEPRRNRFAYAGAAMMWAIGCNGVTVNDGMLSVRAGFNHDELSALWPDRDAWSLREDRAGPFVHRFVAVRREG